MSNPGGTPASDRPPPGSTESASDDEMSAARDSEAPVPPASAAASPPGQGLDVDRGVLPAGGAAELETSGREGAGAFNDYPGPQGALGAMPGSDMAQEPGGTGYTGDFEPVQLPDE